MVTLKELNPRGLPLTKEQQANQVLLFEAVNKLRALYGKPMVVVSGVRDAERQAEIDTLAGRTPRLGSAHISGAAVDFRDSDGALKEFIKKDLTVLERCGLYAEDFAYTPTWLHVQISPPKSGRRVFQPYSTPPPKAQK